MPLRKVWLAVFLALFPVEVLWASSAENSKRIASKHKRTGSKTLRVRSNSTKNTAPSDSAAQEKTLNEPKSVHKNQTQAEQAIVVDCLCDSILLNKNGTKPMYPSSMTKVMTAYVLFQMIHSGDLDWKDTTQVSERAGTFRQGSHMFLKPHQRVSLRDLIHGLIIVSGNDAAVAASEMAAGSEEEFVAIMNSVARNLGMKNSHFRNTSGWPDANHWSTCYDLARLAMRTLEDFPKEYDLYSQQQFTFNGIKQFSLNPLLREGGDGIKTGYTEKGGYGLIGSKAETAFSSEIIQPNSPVFPLKRRIIFVINGLPSKAARSTEAKRLLKWAFSSTSPVLIAKKGRVLADIPVWHGQIKTLPLQTTKDCVIALSPQDRRKIEVFIRYPSLVKDSVKKNQKIGELVVRLRDKEIYRFPLVASCDVFVSWLGQIGLRLFTIQEKSTAKSLNNPEKHRDVHERVSFQGENRC